jgi:outer membrane protein assembly factor BamB
MVAVDPSGTGGVTKSHVVWGTGDRMPNMSSPVVVGDLLFIMNDKGGSMTCLDATTGERIWRNRIPGGGTHWASPLYADGKIYITSKNGSVVVISAARELEVLAENELEAEFIASPAVVGDALLLRSETHLYCIEQK